ncbi:MAG: glycine cleavage system aminomethyltransferase GcvT [Bifidobacteriaceae bacterium]|jgi:aminomethyltransferase|nr:glycine cleavage system aminomethyltransferase GcvT [Bifidobacteriaceae bacterium]
MTEPVTPPAPGRPPGRPPAPPLDSPLDSRHRAAGAKFTDFGGWRLPLRFGSELAEHQAVRQAAGLFDLSHMAQLEVGGPGAADGLDFALLGAPSLQAEGRAAYSMILAQDGGVIDDLIVYRLGRERFFIIANAANRAVVVEALARRLDGFDATLADVTLERALIAVQGPRALAIMRAAGLVRAADLGYYRAAEAEWEGWPVVLARTGYTGEDGFEVSCPKAAAGAIWDRLVLAGRPFGLARVGLAARDTLRLEAGMPLYGHELDRQTTPAEGGQGAFVRPKETDFVGRAALADRAVSKHLVGLIGDGRRAARAGYPVLIDGQVRGRITSGALSPTLGRPIALASINGPAPAVGTPVEVDIRGQLTPFQVTSIPFYRKPNQKDEL